MTTCRKVIQFLLDYVEGTLPENQRASFDQHLAVCEPCRVYLKTYHKTILMARESLCDKAMQGTTTHGKCVPPIPEEMIKAIIAAVKPEWEKECPEKNCH